MKQKFYTRLGFRMTLTIGIILFLVFAFSSYTLIGIFTNDEIERTKKNCLFLSDLIIQNLEHFMISRDIAGVRNFFNTISKSAEIHGASIIASNGVIFFSTNPKTVGMKIPLELLDSVKNADKVFLEDFRKNEKIYSVLRRIENKKECFECHGRGKKIIGVLNINYTFKDSWTRVLYLRNTMVVSAVVSMGFIAVVLYFFNNLFIYRRINKLNRMVERVKGGDLNTKETFRVKDELGNLGDSFNDMVKSLKLAKQELEEQHKQILIQSEKLASIGQLASGIAHEIQNPLAGISGALKVIHSEMNDEDSNKEVLKMILEQVTRLSKTAGDLLSFARPSVPKKISVNLNEIIKQAIFFIQKQAEEQEIKIRKEFEKKSLDILVDPELMKQVFLNIMLNGMQAIKKGGVLSVDYNVNENKTMVEIS
ncbi:MAG: hypothetical protein A2W05_04355, partial [Candidatus Schekmanbacteria bacterium RBG_16_38_10]